MRSFKVERKNYSQLELFSPGSQIYTRAQTPKISFFTYARKHEKVILMVFAFVVCGIVSFSLGVEKGKRLALLPRPSDINLEDARLPQAPAQPKPAQPQIEKKDITQNYIIQLASYRNKGYAEKEALALKKKGLLPLILSKSGYAVLCVGNFSNRESAKSVLSQLKERYQGCFIRRL